jgi:hypothetical protein
MGAPPISILAGPANVLFGFTIPEPIAPVSVTILKVEPGG